MRVALILVSLFLAGCSGLGAHEVELEAYGYEATHSGSYTANLAPVSRHADRPATCIAYVDEAPDPKGRCVVRSGDDSGGPGDRPWWIRATWPTYAGGTVLALDASGDPVALWDGREREDAWYITE